MQLCNYFGIKINNCTPHAETPSFTYNYVLSMIKWFKITFKELTDGTVNSIYKRIVCSMNQQSLHFKSHRIFATRDCLVIFNPSITNCIMTYYQ